MTITVEEEVARWARIRAAELDTSVSRLVGGMLRDRMEADQTYARAQDAFLERKPRRLKEEGGYPDREALHDRPVLR